MPCVSAKSFRCPQTEHRNSYVGHLSSQNGTQGITGTFGLNGPTGLPERPANMLWRHSRMKNRARRSRRHGNALTGPAWSGSAPRQKSTLNKCQPVPKDRHRHRATEKNDDCIYARPIKIPQRARHHLPAGVAERSLLDEILLFPASLGAKR